MKSSSMAPQAEISKIRVLIECALMVAIGAVLMNIKLFELPSGGAVTAASMVPFILVSFRHGAKWGLATGFVSSLLQMLTGFYPPPAGTFAAYAGSILLDYVLAFSCLGLACLFARPFGGSRRMPGIVMGSVLVCAIRFCCSFLSGVLIWSSLAPKGMSPALYSLVYNGSYMLPETAITVLVTLLLFRAMPKLFQQ